MEHIVVFEKSLDFSVRIVNVYKYLTAQKKNTFFPSNWFAAVPALAQILPKHNGGRARLTLPRK